jgi:two-component system, chemotaxis family, CheB/CheR fusion protein
VTTEEGTTAPQLGTDEEFEELLGFIKEHRGFDFTGYKRPTLRRRIAKRMHAIGATSYAAYHEYLQSREPEFGALFDTILINVTGFFRDPAAWDYIASDVIPRLVERQGAGGELRFWSAGCATGEEAYTLAMLVGEALGEDEFRDRVKIYATDVDESALMDGRHGRYTSSQVEDVPEALRERYFEHANGRMIFRPEFRRSVIFGRNDLLLDPPISRIDLIVARNTLMYFGPESQRKILGNFHFALNPDGVLFLGRSEVLLSRSKLFVPLDLKRRVFVKVPPSEFREHLRDLTHDGGRAAPDELDNIRVRHASFETAPVAQVVIDKGGFLAAVNMQARTLFGLSKHDLGKPLQDLELSYRPVELRSRVEQAFGAHHPVRIKDVEWARGSETRWFDVQISPLHAPDGSSLGTGIAFVDMSRYRRLQEDLEHSNDRLETAYEELQSTAEELETTNEELQSTNEELETTNEELQSSNEELETMNEELQSTNEELHTINDEMRQTSQELNQVNAFLESILESLNAGVLVADRDLVVQAWNGEAAELWGLRADEVHGQHLMNLDIGLPLEQVMPLLRSTITDGSVGEALVDATNRRGRAIRCRVRTSPLETAGADARGVIVVMDER